MLSPMVFGYVAESELVRAKKGIRGWEQVSVYDLSEL